jgi:hypothetical protein
MEGLVRAPTDLWNDVHHLSPSRLAAPYDRALEGQLSHFGNFCCRFGICIKSLCLLKMGAGCWKLTCE